MEKNNFDEILKQICPNTIGAIWFSEKSIKTVSQNHGAFDYLIDGGINKFLTYLNENDISVEKENNFFISNSFGSPFILFNTCISKSFSKNDFQDFKMILEKSDTSHDKSLAVIHPKDFTLPDIIKKSKFKLKILAY